MTLQIFQTQKLLILGLIFGVSGCSWLGGTKDLNVKIKLKKELHELAKNFDFAELCITSEAVVVKDEKITADIEVETFKAEGNKCSICWKIKQKKCERSNCPI